MNAHKTLRIVHCVRSPVGGIFRHILDLAHQQAAQGHCVGLILDSTSGGEFEAALIERDKMNFALGITRLPIDRSIGPRDLIAFFKIYSAMKAMAPDVVHTHGAKGGALGRAVASLLPSKPATLYCPHGGSLHYGSSSLTGRVYFTLERLLESLTSSLVFVSEYEMRSYFAKVGQPKSAWTLAYNGLRPNEFTPTQSVQGASDFLYIGHLRDLKGPDVFIKALHKLHSMGLKPTARIVGDGPDAQSYRDLVTELGLNDYVKFHAPMPAREAFALARTIVVPSRAESLPYIVLESIGAEVPLVASNVGGIPEIFGPYSNELVEAGNIDAFAFAMKAKLEAPLQAHQLAKDLSRHTQEQFSLAVMAQTVEDQYERCLRRMSRSNGSLTTKAKSYQKVA